MFRALILICGAVVLSACEPEAGVGFTGIGSQSGIPGYALDLTGLITPGDARLPN